MAMRGVTQLRMAVKSGTQAKSVRREKKATRAAVVVVVRAVFQVGCAEGS